MSRSGQISFAWADGEHTFALKIGQLIELQEKCDAGPPVVLARLESGAWRVSDVRETIRLGLIGGGASPTDALKLTIRYVDERPLGESSLVAQLILAAALFGAPEGAEDSPPEKPTADSDPNPSRGERFDGPPISEQDSPLGFLRKA